MPIVTSPLRVLILGSTGKVATLLRRYWRLNPPENMELFWSARRRAKGVTHVWDPGAPVESLPQCNTVLALWGTAQGGPDTLSINAELAKEAHRVAGALGADRVLHASSAAVYAPQDGPVSEDIMPAPRNAYGVAKHAMEQAVAGRSPRPVCMRIGNVVGAESIFASLAGPDMPVLDRFPDGRGPLRSYLKSATLAASVQALAGAAVERLPAIINVAEACPTDMADILRAADRPFQWKPAPEGAIPRVELDVSRLMSLLGHPLAPVDAGDLVAEWRQLRGRS